MMHRRGSTQPGTNEKFGISPNPLEVEDETEEIKDHESRVDKQVERYAMAYYNQDPSALRANVAGMLISQSKAKQFTSRVQAEFLRNFWRFLMGNQEPKFAKRTPWGNQPLYDIAEVQAYIDLLVTSRQTYLLELELLKTRVPTNLNECYLVFKYIVCGTPLSTDEYLKDWDRFEAAFHNSDQELFNPDMPWHPRPYYRKDGSGPSGGGLPKGPPAPPFDDTPPPPPPGGGQPDDDDDDDDEGDDQPKPKPSGFTAQQFAQTLQQHQEAVKIEQRAQHQALIAAITGTKTTTAGSQEKEQRREETAQWRKDMLQALRVTPQQQPQDVAAILQNLTQEVKGATHQAVSKHLHDIQKEYNKQRSEHIATQEKAREASDEERAKMEAHLTESRARLKQLANTVAANAAKAHQIHESMRSEAQRATERASSTETQNLSEEGRRMLLQLEDTVTRQESHMNVLKQENERLAMDVTKRWQQLQEAKNWFAGHMAEQAQVQEQLKGAFMQLGQYTDQQLQEAGTKMGEISAELDATKAMSAENLEKLRRENEILQETLATQATMFNENQQQMAATLLKVSQGLADRIETRPQDEKAEAAYEKIVEHQQEELIAAPEKYAEEEEEETVQEKEEEEETAKGKEEEEEEEEEEKPAAGHKRKETQPPVDIATEEFLLARLKKTKLLLLTLKERRDNTDGFEKTIAHHAYQEMRMKVQVIQDKLDKLQSVSPEHKRKK